MLRPPTRQLTRQEKLISARPAAEEAKERLWKKTLPVYSLPLKWTANLRANDVPSQLDDFPHFRQASLLHISDPTGECYNLISDNYNGFPTRHQIYDLETRLR